MAEIIQHTTIDGERWDFIAQKYYGKASMMNAIIAANPDVPLYDILPAGIVLDIPILESVNDATSANQLPPWKQI
jgi:phage tail protein X